MRCSSPFFYKHLYMACYCTMPTPPPFVAYLFSYTSSPGDPYGPPLTKLPLRWRSTLYLAFSSPLIPRFPEDWCFLPQLSLTLHSSRTRRLIYSNGFVFVAAEFLLFLKCGRSCMCPISTPLPPRAPTL